MYKLKQDEDCHWYIIPLDLEKRFNELDNAEDWETFEDEFEHFRI